MCQIMLDNSPGMIREKRERFGFNFWQLRTPLTKYRLEGCHYGLDNGCFSGALPEAWNRLVYDAETARPIFVTLPDIVGSAARTLDLFEAFRLRTNGLPRALVLQDGIGNLQIPWDEISCVFVGGSDAFKISREAFDCAKVAKMLGKWVHVGRVNEVKRLKDWIEYADSIDGSGISRFDHALKEVVAFIRGEHPSISQHELCFVGGLGECVSA